MMNELLHRYGWAGGRSGGIRSSEDELPRGREEGWYDAMMRCDAMRMMHTRLGRHVS